MTVKLKRDVKTTDVSLANNSIQRIVQSEDLKSQNL